MDAEVVSVETKAFLQRQGSLQRRFDNWDPHYVGGRDIFVLIADAVMVQVESDDANRLRNTAQLAFREISFPVERIQTHKHYISSSCLRRQHVFLC